MSIRGDTQHGSSRPLGQFAARAFGLAALSWAAGASAISPNGSDGINLPPGVTPLAQEMYKLHMEVFWICVGFVSWPLTTWLPSLFRTVTRNWAD